MSDEHEESLVVTVVEAARMLRLSRGLTYEAVRQGQIPSVKVGRRILIPRVALQRLLDGHIGKDQAS